MLEMLNQTYYGNTIWTWFVTLFLIALSVVAGKIFYWLTGNVLKKLASNTETMLDDIIIDMVEEPLILIGVATSIWFSIKMLTLSAAAAEWVGKLFYVIIIFSIAWLIYRTVDGLVEHYLVPLAEKSETDLDDIILPIVRTTFRFIVWSLACIVALNNAGYDIGAILAGIGLGGLAVAMAARETVANFFGGATIMITRPFTIGNRIRVSGVDGWVKNIGLRTTEVSDFYGRNHIIPNKLFIDSLIENVDTEPAYYEMERFRLRHDTSVACIEKAMEILKQIVIDDADFENNCWVTFDKIGEYSLDIEFWYAIKKWQPTETQLFRDWYQKKSISKNNLHLQIMRQFEQHDIKLALPLEVKIRPSVTSKSLFSDEQKHLIPETATAHCVKN